ncbi:AtzE family amidohydrolase [Paraburkholderia tropica]|uniref:AtzE family amidohydrolase n=1 Tax=Paraburkholderia tropica TaxID=92647 RepID=UPI002AB6C7DD|nr:AtzE family amidohydrolase [Paraburkholderia tropica]
MRLRERSAVDVTCEALDAIAGANAGINAFDRVFRDEAIKQATHIDKLLAQDGDPGPLAGVPFAAKGLFDVAGYPTVAGSAARLHVSPSCVDADAVARMKQAGAVLVGTTHMDELACGATGENPHFGNVRNPLDRARMTGGSSSGSAAAVAAGCVPLALGSDTNGSIRAPAALCGLWSIKPTYGRLSTHGVVPYAESLDCIGGFAADVSDLAVLYETLAGNPLEPINRSMKVALLGGFFETFSSKDAWDAVKVVATHIGAVDTIVMPQDEMQLARGAATILSNADVAAAHAALLDAPKETVSPRLRTRLLAGALSAADWHTQALSHQERFRQRMAALFREFDLLLAPCTPFSAPRFDETAVQVGEHVLEPAKHLGMLTQPISFAGLPVVTVPVVRDGAMPLGVQLIAAAFSERACFAAARHLSNSLRNTR